MTSEPGKLAVKSKIWIEDENGKVVFGSGRLRILNAVEQHGSILAAAKALDMFPGVPAVESLLLFLPD